MQPDPAQVYSPAEDTYLLLDAAQREIRSGDHVLEVGTGSGAIAAALENTARCIIATDINPHAVALARELEIMVVRTDLVAGIRGSFDLILFNPPYLPTYPGDRICDWLEYALDGGMTGRDVIMRFLPDVGRVLAPGGRILLLISSVTGLNEVTDLAKSRMYSVAVTHSQTVEDEKLYVLRLARISE